jgi:hypothetical protein
MYNLSVISNFSLDFSTQTEKTCELYVDMIPNTRKEYVRILWVIEPNEISRLRDTIIKNSNKFDLILTWDKEILKSCSNAKLFPYGTTWIENFEFREKEYCITSLIGNKNGCEGHLMRQMLPERLESVTSIPINLFISANNPGKKTYNMLSMKSGTLKNELFYSQYHIAIENVFDTNWFTEKLIDCFQTKTIPIYVGCTNIGDFFDIRGIFHVKSIDELIHTCNEITPNTYKNMLKYVEHNYNESFKYSNYKKRLKDEINLLLKTKN